MIRGVGMSAQNIQPKIAAHRIAEYWNGASSDAWASANAAGWMWSVGRRGEWVCQ